MKGLPVLKKDWPIVWLTPLLLVAGESFAQSHPGPATRKTQEAKNVGPPLPATEKALLKEFDGWLSEPRRYEKLVDTDCRKYFPEGDLFPYVLPVFAYTNLAIKDPNTRSKAVVRTARLIDLVLPAVVRKVRPPGRKLEKLKRFNKHATYLGQLNVALGCYRLIGGDGRYDKLHERISKLLREALEQRQGRLLESYPHYSWTMDTIPCLLSLYLRELHTGEEGSRELALEHFAWLRKHATDKRTGLPYSELARANGRGPEPPRGCDLSLRISMQQHFAPKETAELYRNYVRSFWLQRGPLSGFAEWPEGKKRTADFDSGPILEGIGMSATGFGLGAAAACGDKARLRLLRLQAGIMKVLIRPMLVKDRRTGRMTIEKLVPYRKACITGFVLGDASLFYAGTWTPWTKEAFARLKASRPAGAQENRN